MGCASSKKKRCRHCQNPYAPVPRSYSMHVHHPAQDKGDSYHVVALKSSTLGSLRLDFKNQNGRIDDFDDHDYGDGDDQKKFRNHCNGDVVSDKVEDRNRRKDISVGLVEAKEWSHMIEQKIPKVLPRTPVATPPGEPETINTWELMEGLEDASTLRSPFHFRSFSFDIPREQRAALAASSDIPKSKLCENGRIEGIGNGDHDHGRVEGIGNGDHDRDDDGESFVAEFDPEVISSFKKSFQELSPRHPFHLRPLENDKQLPSAGNLDSLDAKKPIGGVDLDHTKREKQKLVVYFTSLRGVRKTYEDSCHVRVILKGLGVRVDERDVSMHSGFKDELKELLGDGFKGGGLPRVFLGKKYIGGADEIRRMHEDGQLEKAIEGCERADDGSGGYYGNACEACGDVRFVPCETCSGSCKIYYEREEEEEEEEEEEKEECEGEEGDYGFQRCPDCNENGLIRCPICCY